MDVLGSKISREKKNHTIGKEEVKLSILAGGVTLYVENSKDSIKELVILISEFSKVTGYKLIHKINYILNIMLQTTSK